MFKGLINKIFGGNKANSEVEELKAMVNSLTQQLNGEKAIETTKNIKLNKQTLREELGVTIDNTDVAGVYCEETDKSSDNEVTKVLENKRGIDFSKINGLSIKDDQQLIYALVEELKQALYNTKVDDIFEVANEFDVLVLQQYLLSLSISDNSYHTEFTNIDSLSKNAILEAIVEIHFDRFEKAMKERNWDNIRPSDKQIKFLNDNGIDTKRVLTRFKASELIESISAEKGQGKPSSKQVELVAKLVEKLGFQGYENLDLTTSYSTSKEIEMLQKLADEKFGDDPLTDKQKAYYCNLLKDCKKRATQKVKDKLDTMTQKEFKIEIADLKKLANEINPYLSEGQKKFLISLHDRLRKSYNIDDIATLSKEGATKAIRNLQRELLYQETRLYQASLTMEAINKMSDDEVKERLDTIQKDRKDRYSK